MPAAPWGRSEMVGRMRISIDGKEVVVTDRIHWLRPRTNYPACGVGSRHKHAILYTDLPLSVTCRACKRSMRRHFGED